MAKPHQSEDIHMAGVEQGTGQEVPVVGAQPTKRVTANDIGFFEKDFEQDIKPEIELTREAPGDVDNFQELHRLKMDGTEKQYYSIDATMMIQRVLGDRGYKRLCIIGPRRFGKSLNMSMFESFMDGYCSGDQGNMGRNKEIFNGLNITENDPLLCSTYQQKFFVIKLSFSELGTSSDIHEMKKSLASTMHGIFAQFVGVCGKDEEFQEKFKGLFKFDPNVNTHTSDLKRSLKWLVYFIKKNMGTAENLPKQIALFIDEFDKPYVEALNKGAGFYKEVRTLMDGFLSGVKEQVFDRVFFTGVQPVPFQNPSQCLNSVSVFSIFDPFFCPYYGFTDSDMDQILEETGLKKYKEGFRIRYNGYKAKSEKDGKPVVLSIYNPYSVMEAIKCRKFMRYWCISGASAQNLFDGFKTEAFRAKFCRKLYELVVNGEVLMDKCTVVDPSRSENYNETEAWNNLIYTGYVQIDLDRPDYVIIPNMEIGPFLLEIVALFYGVSMAVFSRAHQALYKQNMMDFAKEMVDPFVILTLHSSRNETAYLVFIFMLVYGYDKCTLDIQPEKKVPGGVSDLVFTIKEGKHQTVYVFEVKYLDGAAVGSKNTNEVGKLLRTTVGKALVQIHDKRYDQQFYKSNVLIRVGVAFTANRFMLGARKMLDGKEEYYDLDDFTGISAADSAPQQAGEHVDDPMIGA